MALFWKPVFCGLLCIPAIVMTGKTAIASGHEESEANNNAVIIDRTIAGSYDCISISTGDFCGRSDWILTVQSDGSRNLRVFQSRPQAKSQMNGFWRVDKNFRPLEAFINVINEGIQFGSAFFAVHDNQMTANVSTPQGTTTDIIDVPEDFSLLLHPVPADGWHFATYDPDKGGVQTKRICVLGAAGPSPLCKVKDYKIEYLGEETITVPAGAISTKRFRFGDATEIWVTNDEEWQVVRHEFSGLDTRYVLTSVEER